MRSSTQTVFGHDLSIAAEGGSSAARLHFTADMLEDLRRVTAAGAPGRPVPTAWEEDDDEDDFDDDDEDLDLGDDEDDDFLDDEDDEDLDEEEELLEGEGEE